VILLVLLAATPMPAAHEIQTTAGRVAGTVSPGSDVRTFKGIPYAAPPLGPVRWRAPQPVEAWRGVRSADTFGARCMQARIFQDMVFRDEMSEDCLYLNVWAPVARAGAEALPVMVWIHGGGFQTGSASEPRQDGERLAGKGVVVVGINYRLGVFGFLAHPELTQGSEAKASGHYGFLDQIAALQWVHDNIAAFGGDPGNVTIFGESAGSMSVSALVASPLARGLFHRAIGESGALFGTGQQALARKTLDVAESAGADLATALGATSLADLRSRSAAEVLEAAQKMGPFRFSPLLDGHVLPQDLFTIYGEGRQAPVPLLAGWNAGEDRAGVVFAPQKTTAATFVEQTRGRFGDGAEALLEVYPASTDEEALESAVSLAGDLFIGYSTWRWIETHRAHAPVYRYSFDRDIPVPADNKINGVPATAKDVGARHAGEIEYVFGTLDSVSGVTWSAKDRALSEAMMAYWTRFARSGDPNGAGLPKWPASARDGEAVLHLDTEIRAATDAHRARYERLDAALRPK
jgi:para-nitrobenzyl esterase